jgi:hypothetical protein
MQNGYIVEINPISIAKGIEFVLSNVDLQNQFKSNLSEEMKAKQTNIDVLTQLF